MYLGDFYIKISYKYDKDVIQDYDISVKKNNNIHVIKGIY